MPNTEDFRTIKLQASIFTPNLSYQSGKSLSHFLSQWPEIFNKIAFAADLPAGVSPEIPRTVIQSEDSHYRLQAGPSRLDLFWIRQDDKDVFDIVSHLNWCSDVFVRYLEAMRGTAGRLASVISRTADDPNPPITLSRHFCREPFLEGHGALNRPSDFELHAGKQCNLIESLAVNSWVRFKTAMLVIEGKENDQKRETSAILLEQDINTRPEELATREFSEAQIREFFTLMPESFDQILSLYFPRETSE